MTTKQKIIAGIALLGAALVALGYATFDQWAELVAQLAGALL